MTFLRIFLLLEVFNFNPMQLTRMFETFLVSIACNCHSAEMFVVVLLLEVASRAKRMSVTWARDVEVCIFKREAIELCEIRKNLNFVLREVAGGYKEFKKEYR